LRIFNEKIIEFFIKKLYEKSNKEILVDLPINENTINKYMNFNSVKLHLFYKQNSYFKLKYGNDFNPDYYDMILLKHEVYEILKKDSDRVLKRLIIENIKNLNEIKVSLFINLIWILVLFGFFITFCFLLNSLKMDFGLLKSLVSLIAILFIIFVLLICFKLITKIDNIDNKEKNEDNCYSLENEYNNIDSDLIVVDRKILK
jgi:hypothetical protein